jgi:SSS family solute:Na+ symporter
LIPILGLIETGGWQGMVDRIKQNVPAIHPDNPNLDYTHMWRVMGNADDNAMGMHWTGIVFGLGAILAMGYWTTDFLVVQRVLTAKDLRAAKMAPIIGAAFKMFVPIIVILPGLLGLAVLPIHLVAENDPTMGHGGHSYNEVLPLMLARYCGPGLLGLGITALLAGFMSGMAGNVTAFNTVFTYDLYQAYFAPGRTDHHYFWAGKLSTIAGILLSIAAAYFASRYNNAMDIIQLVFGFVNAPLFATFLLGMFWKRTTGAGAFYGLAAGIAGSALFHAVTIASGNPPGIKGGYLGVYQTFPSEMAQNFWLAAFSFLVCLGLTLGISLLTESRKTDEDLKGLVYSLTPKIKSGDLAFFQRPGVIGVILLMACVILNLIFW